MGSLADTTLQKIQWRIDHPQFEEKPASIKEFLGKDYLNIEGGVREKVKEALIGIFGEEVQVEKIARVEEALFTGAIGIGKTTLASVALPYMVHWALCMRDPQQYFGLLPGTKIAFMQMSTSESQAREVVFADIDSRIKHSRWFQLNSLPDPRVKKQIKFQERDIWILPGDSSEKTFEGYNILGGVMDEIDSYLVTKNKDMAEIGYTTIKSRITSRFADKGLLILIGQMKQATGFAARRLADYRARPDDTYVSKLTIWDAKGWDHPDMRGKGDRFVDDKGNVRYFYYDTKRKLILEKDKGDLIQQATGGSLMKIPMLYRVDFEKGPDKALRDHAGIPPAVNDPFISLVDRIEQCRDRWLQNHNPPEYFDADGKPRVDVEEFRYSPANTDVFPPKLEGWFNHNWSELGDARKRVIHIDTATSGEGDALGLVMGHVDSIIDIDGEEKPYIVIDLMIRWKAPKGQAIMLNEVRQLIYYLSDTLGFNIKLITMDGFESTDSMQLLRRRGFHVEYLSVDRKKSPYEDLREAIYEGRLEFPKYLTYKNKGDDTQFEVVVKELMELQDTGMKIDHPEGGSKDVADGLAGVVYSLMSNRTFRRGADVRDTAEKDRVNSFHNPMPKLEYVPVSSLPSTPMPPQIQLPQGVAVPSHLKPNWNLP